MTSSAPAEAFVWIHLPGATEPVVAGRVYRAAGDICPQGRAGNEATQAMLIVGSNRMSQLKVCLDAAPLFQLSIQQGEAMIARQIAAIRDNWGAACARPNLR